MVNRIRQIMSRTYRVFLSDELPLEENTFCLEGEASRHLSRVLRVEVGNAVEVLNGRGAIFRTKVVDVNGRVVVLEILESVQVEKPRVAFDLGVSLPKGGKMDEIVRQLTELGVSSISPLFSEHGEVSNVEHRVDAKMEKWSRIATEACKQSGNSWLPAINRPRPFDQWLRDLPSGGIRLIGCLGSHALSVSSLPKSDTTNIAFAIGPEGGFSVKEEKRAEDAGFVPVRFGPHTMKVETAAICALAVACEKFGV
jgi:16S rRNA (uracil1498-N3)-methyltransferase